MIIRNPDFKKIKPVSDHESPCQKVRVSKCALFQKKSMHKWEKYAVMKMLKSSFRNLISGDSCNSTCSKNLNPMLSTMTHHH